MCAAPRLDSGTYASSRHLSRSRARRLAGAVAAQGELTQQGNLRVSFDGQLQPARPAPRTPRAGQPSASTARSAPSTAARPPATARNLGRGQPGRRGLIDGPSHLLRRRRLQQTSTEAALRACRAALVGRGSFAANVDFPGAPLIPAQGKVLAFNSRLQRTAGNAAAPLRLEPGARGLRPSLRNLAPPPGQVRQRCSRPRFPSSPPTSATSPKSRLKIGRTYSYAGKTPQLPQRQLRRSGRLSRVRSSRWPRRPSPLPTDSG